MSYADLDRRAASPGWLVFGWVNIVAIPVMGVVGFLLLAFILAFCDAPGSCTQANLYLVVAVAAPAILWLGLLIALILRRHLVVPLVLAGLGDLLAIAVAVFILMNVVLA